MKKRSIILSSVLVIAICLSLVVGSTFALFTSESKVNVAVSSGKVDVEATVDVANVQTKQYGKDYSVGNNTLGGAIKLEADSVEFKNVVAGDGIKFAIDVKNNSTVDVMYRTVIKCTAGYELMAGLTVKVNGEDYSRIAKHVTAYSRLVPNANPDKVEIEIAVDDNAKTLAPDVTADISYAVEAVQANGVEVGVAETVYIPEGKIVEVSNATGLHNAFANTEKQVVALDNDVVLNYAGNATKSFASETLVLLNGHQLTLGDKLNYVATGKTVSIVDGTVKTMSAREGIGAIQVQGGNLALENVDLIHTGNGPVVAGIGYKMAANITMTNVSIVDNGTDVSKAAVAISSNDNVTPSKAVLNNVNIKSSRFGISIINQVSSLEVNDSMIEAARSPISTDAAQLSYAGVSVKVTDTSLISTESSGVLLNIAGNYEFTNCYLEGASHGAIVRAGDATFTNCEINLKVNEGFDNIYHDGKWSSGTQIAFAALTIGNKQSGSAYPWAANCTLVGTKVGILNPDNIAKDNIDYIYMWGRNDTDRNASLTYDSDCVLDGTVWYGGYVTVNGEAVSVDGELTSTTISTLNN